MSVSDPIPPALRQSVEVVPIVHEKQDMFLLRDREELTQTQLAISPFGMIVVQWMDGKTSVNTLCERFHQTTGRRVPHADVLSLAAQLAEAGLLETAEIQALRQKRDMDFREQKIRPAVHEQSVYPRDPQALQERLISFAKDPKGPGTAAKPVESRAPQLLIAPHIDFSRGGPAYAWAYGALAQAARPDVIVALGVAHLSPSTPWVFTPKRYQTPLGEMSLADDLYQEMSQALLYDARQDESVHQKEHSLEFQAVWLHYIWGKDTPPWVPILCSTFERFAGTNLPSSVAAIEQQLNVVGKILRERAQKGQRILILAGIDLAHVGPRFGDDLPLNDATRQRVEHDDRQSLQHVVRLEADKFYSSVIEDGHWRKVCGLSALYTALRWTRAMSNGRPATGEILTYDQAPDPLGGIVSFTSGIFF